MILPARFPPSLGRAVSPGRVYTGLGTFYGESGCHSARALTLYGLMVQRVAPIPQETP